MRSDRTPKHEMSRPARTPAVNAGRADRGQALRRACVEALEGRRLLSFSPAASYPVGADPQAVATADFNGDRRLDLATANAASNDVSVLLANADGTFQAARNYGIGAYARSLAVGDFNRDGHADLVTANAGNEYAIYAGELSVLFGNADGTFQQPARSIVLPAQRPSGFPGPDPLYQTPLAVAVGDVNADGNLDLAVAARAYGKVLVGSGYYGDEYVNYEYGYANLLLGDGTGAFPTVNASPLNESFPYSVGLADFNADAKLDVVTGNSGAHVSLGNGDGTLAAPVRSGDGFYAGAYPSADFNGDGKLDVLLRSSGASRLNLLEGRGDGTFQNAAQELEVGDYLVSAVVGDVNSDGELDVVATSGDTQFGSCGYYDCYDPTTTDYANVMLGRGDGSFSPPITSALGSRPGNGSAAAVLGDFDRDGRPDLAIAGSAGTASVSLNDGLWVAPPPPPPLLSIGDATVTEGDSGTVNAVFTARLSAASSETVTVQYATAGGTAVAGRDFDGRAGTLTFGPGETSKTLSIAIRGDVVDEYDEDFSVALSDATDAQLADGWGHGTISDNDPPPSIVVDDVAKAEGHSGSGLFNFTVALSAASEKEVWVNYATANGTATIGNRDYAAASSSIYFGAGQTTQTVSVTVFGDKKREANETFLLNLSGASNATIRDAQGVGTILNDDR